MLLGAAAAGPFAGLLANPELAFAKNREVGYGPLKPALDATTGEYAVSLPKGFQYRSITPAGSIIADGNVTPGAFDGMECSTSRNGTVRLVRNHETRAQDGGTLEMLRVVGQANAELCSHREPGTRDNIEWVCDRLKLVVEFSQRRVFDRHGADSAWSDRTIRNR
jgi:secreted PhoX family phosphatase